MSTLIDSEIFKPTFLHRTYEDIARRVGMTVNDLLLFNFGTTNREEIELFRKMRINTGVNVSSIRVFGRDKDNNFFIPSNALKKYRFNKEYNLTISQPDLGIPKPADFTIRFRPFQTDLPFGFDWLRDECSRTENDRNYLKIIGKYKPDKAGKSVMADNDLEGEKLKAQYEEFTVAFSDPKYPDAKAYTHFLNLFPADECPDRAVTASLYFSLSWQGIPSKYGRIQIRVKDPRYQTHVSITGDIDVEHKGNFLKHYIFKIKSLKASSEDIILEAINCTNDKLGRYREIVAGRIVLLKNCKNTRQVASIVFVSVKTNLANRETKFPTRGRIEDTVNNIEKNLGNALIEVKAAYAYLDISTEKEFCVDSNSINKFAAIDYSLGQARYSYIITESAVLDILNNRFDDSYPEHKSKYRVFIFDEVAKWPFKTDNTNEKYVGGKAYAIPSQSLMLFNGPVSNDKNVEFGTIGINNASHEMMHCLGLNHPFANASTFTFPRGQTQNIMDYDNKDSDFFTWKWQWDLMRKNFENFNDSFCTGNVKNI